MSALIVETAGAGQRVYVSSPYDDCEGVVIKGNLMGDGTFDLDMPFTLVTDDGDKVRVSSPWNCHIEVISLA